MKKFVSIVLSLVMVLSVSMVSAMPVMAKKTVASAGGESGTPPTTSGVIGTVVNGSTTTDITYKESGDPPTITATFTGDGKVDKWLFPGLVEGVDYVVISNDGKTVVIQLTQEGKKKQFEINAVVDEGKGKGKDKGKDKGNKSPQTGATMLGVAATGAGIAILTALKKKD